MNNLQNLNINLGLEQNPPGWWSNSTYDEYDKRAKCVADHYSSLVVEELSTASKTIKVNGELTLGENIADIGGNRLSYYAYRKLNYLMLRYEIEENCFIKIQKHKMTPILFNRAMGVRKWRGASFTWINGLQSASIILDT